MKVYLEHIILFILLSVVFLYPGISIFTEPKKKDFFYYFTSSTLNTLDWFPTLEPEEPRLEYSFHNGRWHVFAGRTFMFWYYDSQELNVAITLDPFIEIHNFSEGHYPWQAWRAGTGIYTLWESKYLNRLLFGKAQRLSIRFGIHHESDHVIDLNTYLKLYLQSTIENFPNAGFRAFDNLKLQFNYHISLSNWQIAFIPCFRYYLPIAFLHGVFPMEPINYSYAHEIRAGFSIDRICILWLAYYFEVINTNYSVLLKDIGFRSEGEDILYYNILELSADFSPYFGSRVLFYIGFNYSNGRGVDFINFYEDYTLGIKIYL